MWNGQSLKIVLAHGAWVLQSWYQAGPCIPSGTLTGHDLFPKPLPPLSLACLAGTEQVPGQLLEEASSLYLVLSMDIHLGLV